MKDYILKDIFWIGLKDGSVFTNGANHLPDHPDALLVEDCIGLEINDGKIHILHSSPVGVVPKYSFKISKIGHFTTSSSDAIWNKE